MEDKYENVIRFFSHFTMIHTQWGTQDIILFDSCDFMLRVKINQHVIT